MGMKWDCKLGEDRQIASLLLSDLNLVHDFSLISEKDNLVVASSCVPSKPIRHRLLHVSENLCNLQNQFPPIEKSISHLHINSKEKC